MKLDDDDCPMDRYHPINAVMLRHLTVEEAENPMLVRVVMSVTTVDEAMRCSRCKGIGTEFDKKCPLCTGTGEHEPYTYTYGAPIGTEPGDIVTIPASEYYPSREATVVAVGSPWSGYVVPVVGVRKPS